MWIALAALSAACYGAADFCGGLASRSTRILPVLLVSQLCGLVVAVVAAPLVGAGRPAPTDLAWGAAAGLAGVAGLAVFYRALATTVISVTSPAAAVSGAALPVVFGLLTGETLSVGGWVGLPLGIAAIGALSLQGASGVDRSKARRALVLGLLAGLGFAGFFILVSRSAPGSGLWPLVGARSASVTLLAVAVLVARSPVLPARGALPLTVLAGLLDMAANLLYLLATRVGLVSLVVVVVSLYAAPTVVLARIFLGEKLGVLRLVGVGLALAAVAVMSLA